MKNGNNLMLANCRLWTADWLVTIILLQLKQNIFLEFISDLEFYFTQ